MQQPLVYLAIGGSTALIYLAVATGATWLAEVPPAWASLVGFLAAVPLSYLGHKRLTFHSTGRHRDELPRFIATAVAGVLISASVPELVVQRWHGTPTIGYLIACVCVPALNYLLLALWVFVGNRSAQG